MSSILSIDPGMSTGIVAGEYTEDTPFVRHDFWQIEGGIAGFHEWFESNHWESRYEVWIVEKFTPRPMSRSFKLEELEPIRIEGYLYSPSLNIVWQRPTSLVLAGGKDTAERKKNSDQVLRDMGLWTTGKQVGLKDANDVNSAQKHIVSYLRSIGHKPTLEQLGL